VTETKNGYPQFTGRFQATQFYDEETQAWVPWAEYEQEILGFFVLYTKKDEKWVELLNAQQIKKALGWDGVSFADLANGDYSKIEVMFRVEPREYNGNTTLNVTWIDAADANPTRQLQKYDATKLKELDSKFNGVLAGKKPTPASAKPAGAVTPPKRGRPAGAKALPPASPASTGTAAPTAPPANPIGPPKGCTKDEAWVAVTTNSVRDKDVTDEKLAEAWLAEAAKIGKGEDEFTPADWATVRDAVVKATSKF
jgi:hypothetical protein